MGSNTTVDKVLIDTNVILDIVMRRMPHFDGSVAFLKLCTLQMPLMCVITATQTKDIFFVLERHGKKTADEAIEIIRCLTSHIEILDVNYQDVEKALNSSVKDYEDAMIMFCAERHDVDYIVTRNERDFVGSPVQVLTPTEFLAKFEKSVKDWLSVF
ncbi:MAG: PIN domain-containing protein [Oscillospiraceae bacterium]|nr:PIN domain-containing protein [Oscillospiraceae bacterium]